jgi:hypothetical protein
MILWAGIGLVVAALFGIARGLARVPRAWGRAGMWLLTGAAIVFAECLLATSGSVGRMVGLCAVLLAGMKGGRLPRVVPGRGAAAWRMEPPGVCALVVWHGSGRVRAPVQGLGRWAADG